MRGRVLDVVKQAWAQAERLQTTENTPRVLLTFDQCRQLAHKSSYFNLTTSLSREQLLYSNCTGDVQHRQFRSPGIFKLHEDVRKHANKSRALTLTRG